MDQDETWHAGRPRPWPHSVRWGPSFPSPKGAQPPIFGPYPLQPNGCIDHDATWYGGRPQPSRLCIRWRPRSPSPKGGGAPKFSAHVYYARPPKRWTLVYNVNIQPKQFCSCETRVRSIASCKCAGPESNLPPLRHNAGLLCRVVVSVSTSRSRDVSMSCLGLGH